MKKILIALMVIMVSMVFTPNSVFADTVSINLLPPNMVDSITVHGVTITHVGNVYTINGTSTASTYIGLNESELYGSTPISISHSMDGQIDGFDENSDYTLSVNYISGEVSGLGSYVTFVHNDTQSDIDIQDDISVTVFVDTPSLASIVLLVSNGKTYDNYTFNVMLEKGSVSTSYVDYIEPDDVPVVNLLTYPSTWSLGSTVSCGDFNSSQATLDVIVPEMIDGHSTSIPVRIEGTLESMQALAFTKIKINGYEYALGSISNTTDFNEIDIPIASLTLDKANSRYVLDLQDLTWNGCASGTTSQAPSGDIYIGITGDMVAPVINGYVGALVSSQSDPITVEYITSLLTAYDDVNGDLTSSITITSDGYTSNNDTVGEWPIVYSVQDAAGNVTSITVTVVVVDVESPIITLVGPNVYTLEFGLESTEHWDLSYPTVTITDNVDSNLEAVITSTFNYQELGASTVTYNVTDSNGNVAIPVIVTVNVVDTTAPVVTVTGDSDITVEFGENYTELGATSSETGTVTLSGSVNVGVLGDYVITYTSSDAAGNVGSTTRTVHVVDTTAPVITIGVGSQLSYTVGTALTYTDIIDSITVHDDYDGDITSNIDIISDNYSGNENVNGDYEIRISITDSSGNVSTDIITISVEDNTPPVFSVSSVFMTLEEANAMTLAELYVYFGIE